MPPPSAGLTGGQLAGGDGRAHNKDDMGNRA